MYCFPLQEFHRRLAITTVHITFSISTATWNFDHFFVWFLCLLLRINEMTKMMKMKPTLKITCQSQSQYRKTHSTEFTQFIVHTCFILYVLHCFLASFILYAGKKNTLHGTMFVLWSRHLHHDDGQTYYYYNILISSPVKSAWENY